MFYKKNKFVFLFLCCVLAALVLNTNTKAITDTYKWAKTTVNIRQKPNIKSKSLGLLQDMSKVVSLGKIGKWAIVEYKNKVAYIKSSYLSNKKPRYITKSSPSNTFKSYEDYRCITDSSSKQYKQQHTKAHTDSRTGIRMVGDRYCIALGSYYTKKIGTKVDLVMKSGKVAKCIIADQKADKDTINNHRQHPDGSVVEFVVDTHSLPRMVRLMGDISYVSPFNGSIKSIRIYKNKKRK